MALADALRQALIKNLAAMAAGQGGDPDVFSAELDREIAAAVSGTALAGGQP